MRGAQRARSTREANRTLVAPGVRLHRLVAARQGAKPAQMPSSGSSECLATPLNPDLSAGSLVFFAALGRAACATFFALALALALAFLALALLTFAGAVATCGSLGAGSAGA